MKQKRAEPEKVDALLLKHYGKYPAETNPKLMDELLWFMLSTRTTVQSCEKAFQACKLLFPTHDAILKSRQHDLPRTQLLLRPSPELPRLPLAHPLYLKLDHSTLPLFQHSNDVTDQTMKLFFERQTDILPFFFRV